MDNFLCGFFYCEGKDNGIVFCRHEQRIEVLLSLCSRLVIIRL